MIQVDEESDNVVQPKQLTRFLSSHIGKNKTLYTPYVSYLLTIVFIIVFIIEMWQAGWIFEELKENPLAGPNVNVLYKVYAKYYPSIVYDLEYQRLVVPNFLHGGIIHLIMNCLSFFALASIIERNFGSIKTLFIFMNSGINSYIISSIFAKRTLTTGSSGGIFGLFGALFPYILTNWVLFNGRAPKLLFKLIIIMIVNVIMGFIPLIDNWSHGGGFITGFIAGFGLLQSDRVTRYDDPKEKTITNFTLQFVALTSLPFLTILPLYYGLIRESLKIIKTI